MINNFLENKIKSIAHYYPHDHQKLQAIAELNECSEAIATMMQEELYGDRETLLLQKHHLIDEVADAFIMLYEIMELWKIKDKVFQRIPLKVDRQLKRIENDIMYRSEKNE